ncbi:Beta-glucosidase [Flagellimonas maritima]|uniref:beta-glucosidase n=1 Tax=Flagellimonas maritima TaxID=1383885 RepID=A0A2Z4LSZ9_9FLAO|nr:beta-glucosidase BglX [Allomuricauda aurantiaca]AWX44953.1 Beta-glucosidase [Allomuricauda aurantiaca]
MKVSHQMLNIAKFICFCFLTTVIHFANAQSNFDSMSGSHPSFSEILSFRVDSVLNLMTINEKIGQLVQYSGGWDATGPSSSENHQYKLSKLKKGEVGSMLNVTSVAAIRETQQIVMENSRLKIPLIFAYDVIHGYKTIFPIPLGESASWDLEIIQKSASIAAKESAASGLQWTFAPMLDVSRDARWGRIMEGAGEDPYLTSKIGVARIKGFQGGNLNDKFTVAACAKHFAGYGFGEAGRDYNTVNIGDYELHNTVLPPFKAAAKSGVATFMNAFNDVDGIPATGHRELQHDILKGKWNWDGFIVSDWGSIGEMIAHGFAEDKKQAAEIAMNSGSDMDMESYAYEGHLAELLTENKITESQLNDAVKRILKLKFELGLFDDPYKYCDETRERENVYTKEHLKIARDVARKSIVLLKNENKTLPLSKSIEKIAVIGPLGDDKDVPLGNWRGKGVYNSAVSLLEGIKNKVDKNVQVSFAKGIELMSETVEPGKNQFLYPIKFNTKDKTAITEAVELAKKSDVVLLSVGENAYQTGEGRSQVNIGFAGLQNELIDAVTKANENVVVVLMNGRPMDLSEINKKVSTILECWHLGSQAGNAISDVIFGDYNPSGKLPVSFPYDVGQEPLYYNQKNTGRPYSMDHVTFSSYRDAPKEALFPFGFGLSYTNFKYSDLKLSRSEISKDGSLIAKIRVTNTGDKVGEEVVQLYIRDLVGSLVRPIRELKGFEKIKLKPQESRTVSFEITPETLQFYTQNKKWEVEPGTFQIWIGGDSKASTTAKFSVQ